MRVLGLVPARGGSKGVPRKNLADVGGRPLIALTIETAQRAERLDRVVVSTDDEEIAEVARSLGADTPFMRPPGIADDQAPMLGVVQHALRALAGAGDVYDAVCLLQPTSPLRPTRLIDDCIELMERRRATAVVTVRPIPPEHNPAWALTIDDRGYASWPDGALDPISRRQDLPEAFHRDGLVYVTRSSVAEGGSLYGTAVVPADTGSLPLCNIDTPADLAALRALVERGAWRDLESMPIDLERDPATRRGLHGSSATPWTTDPSGTPF